MDTFSELRIQAEKILQDQRLLDENSSHEDVRHLVHELRVHQIELELQNEELRTIQRDIEASRNQYADLYNFAPVGYFTLDSQGIILNVNVTAVAMLNQERTHLLGQGLAHFVDWDAQDTYYLYIKNLLESLKSRTCDIRVLKKNGAPLYAQLEGIAVQDKAGNITGIRVAMSDMTERRQAEQKISESSATLRALLDSSYQSFTLIDREYRIQAFNLSANADAKKFFGHEITLGDSIERFVLDSDRENFDRSLTRVLQGESVRLEEQLRGADGHTYWLLYDYTPVRTEDGRIIGVCVGALDISARKYAEDALREAKYAAEAANRAKSTFLANMSHELRTPLTGILGYAQILKEDAKLTPKQHDGLAIIERNGLHLLGLINAILDFAKIEAGKVELTPTNVDARALLNDINMLFRPQAEAKGLSLQFESDAPFPRTIRVDEQRLHQVLLNLLGNAVKFTETGGVTLRVTPIPLQGNGPEQPVLMTTLRFDVSDTGIGIAPENLMRLFEPFQQVGDDAYNAQGTGLGLAISRDLIRLMGGDLQMTSVLGHGSRFWFELTMPVIAAVDARRSQSRKIVGIQGETPKILVVEDDPINRQMLVDLLTDLGCDLREADNGQSGWQACRTFHPQAILLDLRMPKMDGLTLMRHIRRAPELDQVAIIAMSACVYAEDRQQSLDAGSQAFLPKPINLDLLLELLQRCLHLTWRFQEIPGDVENVSGYSADESPSSSALTPEALTTLPAEMLRRLKKAAIIADRDVLNHVFEEIRPSHPHIADGLTALTQNLDNSMIIDFIAQLKYKKAVE